MIAIRIRYREQGRVHSVALVKGETITEKIALWWRGYRPHWTYGGYWMMKRARIPRKPAPCAVSG